MQLMNDYKTDWSECYELFAKWWSFQNDKPMINDFRLNEAGKNWTGLPLPEDHRVLWTDIEGTIDRAEDQMAHMIYEGPYFPYYSPSLGPGSLALFLGCNPVFSQNTVWYEPCFDNISDAKAILNPDNEWFRWTKQALTRAMERSAGRYMVAIPDMIEGLDCAAEMLGNEKLLFAMVEQPEEVHRLVREITDCYQKAFDELYDIISPDNDGNSFIAFQILGKGKTAKFQSDISAMLSPAMFDEFVVPYLTEHTEKIEYSLYHLDGFSALQHVDSLCKIDSLNAIQWVPGAGKPECWEECWFSLYEQILGSGKGLQVGFERKRLDAFLRRFDTKGLFLMVW